MSQKYFLTIFFMTGYRFCRSSRGVNRGIARRHVMHLTIAELKKEKPVKFMAKKNPLARINNLRKFFDGVRVWILYVIHQGIERVPQSALPHEF